MLTPLRTPVEDTRATDLCLELTVEPSPGPHPESSRPRSTAPQLTTDAVLPLELGGVRLQLSVRGTTHQAVLGCERGWCSEVVRSRPHCVGLPNETRREIGVLQYRFSAEVVALAPAELSEHARALRAEVGRDRNGLVGSCPDDPEALTALRARRRDGEVRWQTWRAYPRTGEIVVTRTSVRVA